ncbi:MAG: ATP-binding protein [Pseudomonadota bacterium]
MLNDAKAKFAGPIATDNWPADNSVGRIVSVTGAKAIALLDERLRLDNTDDALRPEMGTLLAISQQHTTVLAIVTALSVPVPAQREGDAEVWIAELTLVGELWLSQTGEITTFNRGVTQYPTLGDRVRVASKDELHEAFCGNPEGAVRVGNIRQDSSIPAMVRVDDLLGKHFAILGTTGTGKSCTTALILRAILEENPNAHIVLLDPHNEYATAFSDWGEVISPRNVNLPYWLLNFEEIVEVLVGSPENRKAEIEILQELIPIAKSQYTTPRGTKDAVARRRGNGAANNFTVDTPVPYRMSDIVALIDERMGKLENKRDLHPYRQLKNRIEAVGQDARYAFMFGSVTVYDSMADILGRFFRVPVNNRPISILELTGLPTEIVNVVVSVLCRMTFDFALWGEGRIPVTLVCEEAHRYVPANTQSGFEPCKRAIAKIAKEGRKYGASLCIVTQRPAEIDPTILSQCNTVFALRMSNDRDQQIVQSAVSDTGQGLLEFLPALGQREAIAFGDGVALPVRLKFKDLEKQNLPRSSTARFSEMWQTSVGDEDFLERIVERWRTAGAIVDHDSLELPSGDAQHGLPEAVGHGTHAPADSTADRSAPMHDTTAHRPDATASSNGGARTAAVRRTVANSGSDLAQSPRTARQAAGTDIPRITRSPEQGPVGQTRRLLQKQPVEAEPKPVRADSTDALKSLRERLMKR